MAIDHNKLCETFGCKRYLFDSKDPQNTKTISQKNVLAIILYQIPLVKVWISKLLNPRLINQF